MDGLSSSVIEGGVGGSLLYKLLHETKIS